MSAYGAKRSTSLVTTQEVEVRVFVRRITSRTATGETSTAGECIEERARREHGRLARERD
jgi:hypothetical protein